MRPKFGATGRWVAAAILAVGAGLFTTTHGDVGWDGMWVLQVVSRMHAGDVLYRDVFCGVPPLAFLVASAAARLVGVELFALRLLLVVVLTLSYLVSADLVQRVTGTRRYDLVLAPMMLIWALPANVPLYQPIANLFLLVSFDAVAWWSCRSSDDAPPSGIPLLLAGAAAGLSFASKQTTGAYALLGVAAVVGLEHWRRRSPLRSSFLAAMAAWAATGIAFAATVAVALAPVALNGGWQKFLDYGFFNKTTYLRVAGVPYGEELATFLRSHQPGASFDFLAAVRNQPFLLPLLLVPAVVVLLRARQDAARGARVVLCLALVETATLYPRADIDHVIPGVPGMLVALLTAWHIGLLRITSSTSGERDRDCRPKAGRWTHVVEAACMLVVVAGVVVRLGASAAAMASDGREWSRLPHLRHVLIPRTRSVELERQAQRLREAAPGGELFLLVPNAGLYYLVSGLKNPTPFDYPLETAFGRTGEGDVAQSMAEGRLRQVCMTPVVGRMAPERLQHAVLAHLSPEADLGACTLYRRWD